MYSNFVRNELCFAWRRSDLQIRFYFLVYWHCISHSIPHWNRCGATFATYHIKDNAHFHIQSIFYTIIYVFVNESMLSRVCMYVCVFVRLCTCTFAYTRIQSSQVKNVREGEARGVHDATDFYLNFSF